MSNTQHRMSNVEVGVSIPILATYDIMRMLIDPPLIGYISHAFSLRIAFIAFALAGLMLIPISRMFFKTAEAGRMSRAQSARSVEAPDLEEVECL